MSELINKIKMQQMLSAEEMVIQKLKEKGLIEYTDDEKEINKMADKTIRLCNTERRLIKEAAEFICKYQYVCPHNDVNLTYSKVKEWIKEFKELEESF